MEGELSDSAEDVLEREEEEFLACQRQTQRNASKPASGKVSQQNSAG